MAPAQVGDWGLGEITSGDLDSPTVSASPADAQVGLRARPALLKACPSYKRTGTPLTLIISVVRNACACMCWLL